MRKIQQFKGQSYVQEHGPILLPCQRIKNTMPILKSKYNWRPKEQNVDC